MPSREFAAWRDSKPTLERHGIAAVIEGRSARGHRGHQRLQGGHREGASDADAEPSLQQLADNAIARARSPTPMSLSEIPGSPAPVDTTRSDDGALPWR